MQIDLTCFRPACPICASRRVGPIATALHKRIAIHYSYCRDCSVIFQSPTIPEDRLGDFYSAVYPEIYERHDDADLIATQGKRAAVMVEYVADRISVAPSKVMEIGCSAGMLGRAILNRFAGVRYFGVELDDTLAAKASGHFPVKRVAEDHGESDFDLILMSHSLEHFFDPVAYLTKLADMLATAGRIIIEVPNGNAGSGFEIAHPFIFTTASLAKLANRAGLGLLHATEHNSFKVRTGQPIYLSATFGRGAVVTPTAPTALTLRWKIAANGGRMMFATNVARQLLGKGLLVKV